MSEKLFSQAKCPKCQKVYDLPKNHYYKAIVMKRIFCPRCKLKIEDIEWREVKLALAKRPKRTEV